MKQKSKTNTRGSSIKKKASRLIKIQSVREQIEVSSTTLWRMEKRGDLVPVRINGVRYWRQEDLDQLVAIGGAA
jgi:predicted DNA-binding transcriptional regulator AlpA